jgi:hypothetical protein
MPQEALLQRAHTHPGYPREVVNGDRPSGVGFHGVDGELDVTWPARGHRVGELGAVLMVGGQQYPGQYPAP